MLVGRYEVLREIGRGGMGVVLKARAPDGREVAIKVLLERGGRSEAAAARFEREQRLLAELGEADGFVPLLEAGSSPSGPFIVMPYLEGGTLRGRLDRGPLEVSDALALARRLARALGVAHARGIVHRDLKPENILFTRDGLALVADLGLAKHWDPEGAGQSVVLSRTGELKGTAGYLPPEQLNDAKSAGPPADVFALGAILYECLAGTPAFTGESLHALLSKAALEPPVPIRQLRPETPRWVSRVLDRALEKDPRDRFPDGADLARALDAQGSGHRWRGVALLGGLLALGVAVSAAIVIGSRPVEPAPAPAPTAEPSARVLYERGLALATGQGVPKDEVAALTWFQKAAAGGDARAMSRLGSAHATGAGTPRSIERAIEWWRKAADAGDADAMHTLGALFLEGKEVPKDEAAAVSWYRPAAARGHPAAMFQLGFMLCQGRGAARDDVEGERWTRKAAEAGYPAAMRNYGAILHARGRGRDRDEAAQWWRKAAVAGDAIAMSFLGRAYENGVGVEIDHSASARWHRKAAEGGVPDSMYMVGLYFATGAGGVERSDAEAVRWYRRAAAAGQAKAMNNLGVMISKGLGAPQDLAEAARWYRKASDAGEVEGTINVARVLEHGWGVEKDREQAIEWYRKAAKAGSVAAKDDLARLGVR